MLVTARTRAKAKRLLGSTKGERILKNSHQTSRSQIGKEMPRKALKLMRKRLSTPIKVAGVADP
jgi:hypothetical protein